MKKKSLLCLLLAAALLIAGCGPQENTPSEPIVTPTTSDTTPTDGSTGPEDPAINNPTEGTNPSENGSEGALITLNGDSAVCSSNAVQISGSTVTILDEGTYILSGTLDDGMVIINSDKNDKTRLILNGVTIHSTTSAPIYILNSDKVTITLAEGSVNTLSNGGTFTAIDENNIDAVIFSKEDLVLDGSGTLTVTSPAGHGIVSKDSLTVNGGAYDISTASHGLSAKDDITVTNGSFTITSGKDGIHAENADDAEKGFVCIEGGTFAIRAEGDGISASAHMQILGGSFDIISGGGSANGEDKTSDPWGGPMGGGRPGGHPWDDGFSADEEEDTPSTKGIKATADLVINGGTFRIDSADDALHSNTNLTVNAGTFTIATGDDAFHADETLTITSGTVSITESYEGLEGLHIRISGGDITLVASDDGLNAAGGTDQSGFGGRGGDQFGGGWPGGMGGGNSDGSITISGGVLHITASGDGIDANGTLTISGGFTTVCGPTRGDTATLDYDISAVITGGTFIGTGAAGMAQTFSDSEQGVIAVSVGQQAAGTRITLTDEDGNVVIDHTPALSFAVVILSSPDIIKGETYKITVGSASGEFAAD